MCPQKVWCTLSEAIDDYKLIPANPGTGLGQAVAISWWGDLPDKPYRYRLSSAASAYTLIDSQSIPHRNDLYIFTYPPTGATFDMQTQTQWSRYWNLLQADVTDGESIGTIPDILTSIPTNAPALPPTSGATERGWRADPMLATFWTFDYA